MSVNNIKLTAVRSTKHAYIKYSLMYRTNQLNSMGFDTVNERYLKNYLKESQEWLTLEFYQIRFRAHVSGDNESFGDSLRFEFGEKPIIRESLLSSLFSPSFYLFHHHKLWRSWSFNFNVFWINWNRAMLQVLVQFSTSIIKKPHNILEFFIIQIKPPNL